MMRVLAAPLAYSGYSAAMASIISASSRTEWWLAGLPTL